METPLPFALCVPKSTTRTGAFSLVEVAIAMGIASFVLISLLGLMTVSMDASRRSYEDTTVASLAQTVVSELKTTNFNSIVATTFDRYFTYDGTPTNSAGSYYLCHGQVMAHTSPNLPAAATNTKVGARLRLDFFWNGKTNESFETSLAQY